MRAPPKPRVCVLVLERPVLRDDLPALIERLRALVADSNAEHVVCDARGLPADLDSVDALVRLRIATRRLERLFDTRHVSPELAGLIAFCGLGSLLCPGYVSRAGRPKRSKTDSTLPSSTGVSGQRSKTSGE
jgi:hypothetical protein